MIDLLLINPGAAHGIYGALGDTLTACEPPLWCRLIAGYARDRGYSVAIIDQEVEELTPEGVAARAFRLAPQLIAICVFGHQPSASTQQMYGARLVAQAIKSFGSVMPPIVMLGGHVSALPERTLREEPVDFVVKGEGLETIIGLLKLLSQSGHEFKLASIPGVVWWSDGEPVVNSSAPLIPMDQLHGNVWDLLPMDRYRAHNWQVLDGSPRAPYASIMTSLGCPYKCLAGDTPIDTIYGLVPIRELVRQNVQELPIFTFNPKTKRGLVATAINIRQYGQDKLVRVHFDDNTYIDCTPDHQFLQFKWGPDRQWPCEAHDLQPGAHVRALRYGRSGLYPLVSWTRRGRKTIHRLVAEWKLKRSLIRSEHVHHIDHDPENYLPENLLVCSAKEHAEHHPEHAQRMRDNNPTKGGMSDEWRNNTQRSLTGLKRTPEAIERYRAAAIKREASVKGQKHWWTEPDGSVHLSVKGRHPDAVQKRSFGLWWTTPDGKTYQAPAVLSPEDVHGRLGFNPHQVNHRVTHVEELEGLHDVYCLEVPETGWFYANNVLVKNCHFCCINAPFDVHRYRMREPAAVVAEIIGLYNNHGVRTLKIVDEMFVLNHRHVEAICDGLIEYERVNHMGLNIWGYSRVDTVDAGLLPKLRAAGVKWLALGIESGSKHVRDGSSKRLRSDDIIGTVRQIQDAGINVIGNYIFGLPDDDMSTMQETLDLALEANCEWANFYCAMAYPGSPLYDQALREGWTLPAEWAGYSQHNRHSRPLDTKHISAAEVLRFRDEAFQAYFSAPSYRAILLRKFGHGTIEEVDKMLNYRLERDLLK